MAYRYLFGPVPSRRLGISLGIDLVPHKICTMNCVYCECGGTTRLTLDRDEYVPTDEVLREVDAYLADNPWPEILTFSGAGEPTLHSGIGRIIRHLKSRYRLPLALITNSSLLGQAEVRDELLGVDLVLPSLDAASVEAMARINRPHPDLTPESIIDGLSRFRDVFNGRIWLEIFILAGINTQPAELEQLKTAIERIRPDRVQLNSLDRPGTESWVRKVPPEELEAIARQLNHPRVEVICRYRNRRDIHSYRRDTEEAIVETVSRRPCTLEDLSEILGMHRLEVGKYLDVLETEGRIHPRIQDRGIFYSVRS